jgi:hypothetical protein
MQVAGLRRTNKCIMNLMRYFNYEKEHAPHCPTPTKHTYLSLFRTTQHYTLASSSRNITKVLSRERFSSPTRPASHHITNFVFFLSIYHVPLFLFYPVDLFQHNVRWNLKRSHGGPMKEQMSSCSQ